MSDCYRCEDYLEDRQICYVCYQQMKNKLEELKSQTQKENRESAVFVLARMSAAIRGQLKNAVR